MVKPAVLLKENEREPERGNKREGKKKRARERDKGMCALSDEER